MLYIVDRKEWLMNYILLANGYETIEALAVVDMLKRAGIPITMVSMNDTLSVITAHDIEMKADVLFTDVNISSDDMIILPGGMPGTVNLENNNELCSILREHNAKGGKLAAICAAPRILGKLGILEGKRACCYPGNEDQLSNAIVSMKAVESDRNCITSRGMGTALQFGAAIIEMLSDKATADSVLEKIQYNTSEE